ncbi:hypothetical protein [Paraburkholderia tropica]|uniref:hypothetical protein n=1 Tax=Paraburkholderia tropica TaxID=92647 RepID=UPI000A85CAA5|nr:hypothetical protein [Paraburkholderia tropica]
MSDSMSLPLFDTKEKPDTRRLTDLALSISPTMRQVSEAQFFAYIGPRDVSPSAHGESGSGTGMFSLWKTRSGDVVGKSFGGDYRSDHIFLLRSDLA